MNLFHRGLAVFRRGCRESATAGNRSYQRGGYGNKITKRPVVKGFVFRFSHIKGVISDMISQVCRKNAAFFGEKKSNSSKSMQKCDCHGSRFSSRMAVRP